VEVDIRDAPTIIDGVIADLEALVAMDERQLQYLKQRQLVRAYSLLVELMGKRSEE